MSGAIVFGAIAYLGFPFSQHKIRANYSCSLAEENRLDGEEVNDNAQNSVHCLRELSASSAEIKRSTTCTRAIAQQGGFAGCVSGDVMQVPHKLDKHVKAPQAGRTSHNPSQLMKLKRHTIQEGTWENQCWDNSATLCFNRTQKTAKSRASGIREPKLW